MHPIELPIVAPALHNSLDLLSSRKLVGSSELLGKMRIAP
jgi:hypothetical protein